MTHPWFKYRDIGSLILIVLMILAATASHDEAPSQAAGTLAATGSMNNPRSGHAATLLPDGTVLITGGFGRNERDIPGQAERFDPAQGTFRPAGTMLLARQSHEATLLEDGRVLITGGFNGSVLGNTEIYDPTSKTFSTATALIQARFAHRATLLQDGRVLITGGLDTDYNRLADTELYNPKTGRFTPTGSMTTARTSHTQTLLHDGRVLITGGSTGARRANTIIADAEVYDPETGRFEAVSDMNTIRHKHAATLLADGRVLISAGSDGSDWKGQYTSSELFDPETGRFTPAHALNTARFKHRAATALLQDGRALIAGGAATAEVYDPAADRFMTVAGTLDAPRFFSTVTPLPDGQVLIAGGYNRQIESTNRAWLYKP